MGTGEYAARLVKSYIGEVFAYAIITKRASINPTYILRDYIEFPAHEHAKPMEAQERSNILKNITDSGSTLSTKNAARALLYSMLRTIEVRRGLKSYINWDDQTWTIPVASKKQLKAGQRNMKKNRIHIVPLSTQMMAIIQEQFEAYPDSPYIFPGRNGMMGSGTLYHLLRRVGFSLNSQ